MPLLTSIDEYERAIRTIAAHAETALLTSDPQSQEAVLRFILAVCQETDDNIEGPLTGPLPALLAQRWLQVFP